jgi:hypothetical protein
MHAQKLSLKIEEAKAPSHPAIGEEEGRSTARTIG